MARTKSKKPCKPCKSRTKKSKAPSHRVRSKAVRHHKSKSKVTKKKAAHSKARGKSGSCVNMSHLQKYKDRPSPPYPANMCCGRIMLGNDRRRYISKPASNGICRWVRL